MFLTTMNLLFLGDDEMPTSEKKDMRKLSPSEPILHYVFDLVVDRRVPLTKVESIIKSKYGYWSEVEPPYTIKMRIMSRLNEYPDVEDRVKSLLVEISNYLEAVCVEPNMVWRIRNPDIINLFLRDGMYKDLEKRTTMLYRLGNNILYMIYHRRTSKLSIRLLRAKNITDPLLVPRSAVRTCGDASVIVGFMKEFNSAINLLFKKMMNALSS